MWKALEDAQQTLGIPELSAARFTKGRWSFFGDPDRLYPIASVTKTFTARAVELAGIRLDTKVREHLPEFRLHDPRATRLMKVRDLLCHRSGLPPHTWAWVFAREPRREWIANRLPHLQHVGPFDQAYRYSNITYAIAGALLPGDWEDFLKKEILGPLGLRHTRFLPADWHLGTDVAPPHKAGRGVAPFVARANHLIGPASELMSSAGDLARWLEHWRGAKTECTTSQVRMGGPKSTRWYALGWRREKDLLWHTGSCTGYSAIVSMRVGGREAMCILCNQHGVNPALEKLIRGEPVPARERPPMAKAPRPPQNTPPHAELLGRWEQPGYGELSVEPGGNVQFHQTPAGKLSGQVWRMQPYDIEFKVASTPSSLSIPLETQVDPIKFMKRD